MTTIGKDPCFQRSSNQHWLTRKAFQDTSYKKTHPESFRWGEKDPLYTIFLREAGKVKMDMKGIRICHSKIFHFAMRIF